MPVPDHLLRFWRAIDARTGHVQPTWWGAVVTDARSPAIWDANYARVETDDGALTADEVEAALLPALAEAGAPTIHIVGFRPEAQAPLFAELQSRGHVLAWDVVMDLDGDVAASPTVAVEELEDGDELWAARLASFALFGIDDQEACAQLLALERLHGATGAKRWFGVRDREGLASTAALAVLADVGFIDGVATADRARSRGYASALTKTMARAASDAGASHVCLLADPAARPVIAMYERLGFRESGRLPSTKTQASRSGGAR
jgi:ribosomal protein S18 acetylase RimI-like enzyme